MGDRLVVGGVQQQVVLQVALAGDEVPGRPAEVGHGIGLECRQLIRRLIPLRQVVDLEEAGHRGVGVGSASLGELRAKVIGVHALGVVRFDRDAELKHAGTPQEPHEVLGVVEASAFGGVAVVGVDEFLQTLGTEAELLGDGVKLRLPRARPHHRHSRLGIGDQPALEVDLLFGVRREAKRPLQTHPLQAQLQHHGQLLLELQESVGDGLRQRSDFPGRLV